MTSFDSEAFEFALSQIKDGDIFERFAQDFLCQYKGQNFHPVGGIHDRGIDGLERCYEPEGVRQTIYQMSIEADTRTKVRKTLTALQKADIPCTRLFYVTSRKVKDQDSLEEDMFDEFGVVAKVHDLAWLRGNVNSNEGTLRTYLTLIESHFHQFTSAGSSPIAIDFESDPRLYVFLRQQWEASGRSARLDEVLVDSLILFALEGTDPDKNILMSRSEILTAIHEKAHFSSKVVEGLLDKRLQKLSRKPRRIRFHRSDSKYCLPYETRLELDEKNLADAALHTAFREGATERLSRLLEDDDAVEVKDAEELLYAVINSIFKKQGLEFAEFVARRESAEAVEQSLDEIISQTVDESSLQPKKRHVVKRVLLSAIRDLIYRGSDAEVEFLRRLADSYVMLFLLQIDPQLATYFSSLAGRLRVFVDNSILVPAISEYPLEVKHRRHWNLLANANRSGVQLLLSPSAQSELAGHFRKVLQRYEEEFKGQEEIYADEEAIQYCDEILIRSYFYARLGGSEDSFEEFINHFVTPHSRTMEEELAEWLRGTFGIKIVRDQIAKDVDFKKNLKMLTAELQKTKGSHHQAASDSQTILRVYAMRERDSENDNSGVFGYRTWWLSTDTTTQKAVEACFGRRFRASCHMRTDFLHHYICLAPSVAEVNEVFEVMFPSLLGVNVSHHIPPEVSQTVRTAIRDHGAENPARVRGMIRGFSERLKSEATVLSKATARSMVKKFFPNEKKDQRKHRPGLKGRN